MCKPSTLKSKQPPLEEARPRPAPGPAPPLLLVFMYFVYFSLFTRFTLNVDLCVHEFDQFVHSAPFIWFFH